jgi:acyl carrier protein
MVPRTIVPLESLPLTANGKVDRRALPGPGGRRVDRDRTAVAPRSDLERRVARIWSELLQLDGVGVEDDFFELGGHSLLATRIVARVRDELGVDLPLLEFFSAPTVAGLAAVIERDDAGEGYAFDLRVGDEVATVYLSEAEMASAGLPDDAFNLRRARRRT